VAGKTIVLCAGEASGDQLGAGLIVQLRLRLPDARFVGIGGSAMRAAGMETWWDSQTLSVMGLVEVLRHLPRLLAVRRAFIERIADCGASIYVGIDAPDFNLPIERRLKARGMRTVHYVSPSIWAWRQKRAAKIGRSADCVLCLFPFEPALYARYGVAAHFVGHPFADEMPLKPDRAAARELLGQGSQRRLLALLPGSRAGEIERLGADFVGAAQCLLRAVPDLRVLIAAHNEDIAARMRLLIDTSEVALRHRFVLVIGQMRPVLAASDVALVASGTATLEALLSRCPMVVAYRIAALTYWIVRTFGLLKVRLYSLPNVLAGRQIVPEITQNDVSAVNLSNALMPWFDNGAELAEVQTEFERIHVQLRCDASARAAEEIVKLLP